MRGLPADGTLRKLPLSPRQGTPVSDDSRRWNGAQWKSQPVERFTGGFEMERSGSGSNWRSQAPNAADVSLKAAFGGSSAVKGSFGTPRFATNSAERAMSRNSLGRADAVVAAGAVRLKRFAKIC
jgi:hypothetical protein